MVWPVLAMILIAPDALASHGRNNAKIALAGLGLVLCAVIGMAIYRRAYGFAAVLLLCTAVYVFFVAAAVVYIGVPTQWW